MKKIFFLYPDSMMRKGIYEKESKSEQRSYALFGKDRAAQYGFEAHDDFDICEKIESSIIAKIVNTIINKIWKSIGGYGGAWYKVFRLRSRIKDSDIIFATADRVGIPLVLLTYIKIIPQRHIVYVSIGLPERLDQLKNKFVYRLYRKAFKKVVSRIVCYGYEEAVQLRKKLGATDDTVIFMPFGVDVNYFDPSYISTQSADDKYMFCIGADPQRDFELLFEAVRDIDYPLLVVTTKQRYAELKEKGMVIPKSVTIKTDIPFKMVREYLSGAQAVLLPVKENTYSGATTTLLQAMALGKPVLVSQTGAIKDGYFLQDRNNCMLVRPGDIDELRHGIKEISEDTYDFFNMGKKARETVENKLNWDVYVGNIFSIFNKLGI
ncbi:hypothetical protein C0581_02935 [Candidatus Parcubacteria bacterium]|nr:MAG: hypothetical protein C0581_02935 [Candidatus Parcubacteria bacterium]